ncbi:unnamed protein product [Orchesella dallaii]|uniref:Uncharacterized protein n=1 Tax=Orchesella dallaii TaxID=48710 RepID=A0ABP1RRF9_9HEXA
MIPSLSSLLVILVLLVLIEFHKVNSKLFGRFERKQKPSNERKEEFKNVDDNAEDLKDFIEQVDSSGVLRKFLRRKMYLPEDSSLTFTSQVSRPNIFPNIFNQGEGFIVDAVVEWPIWLNLHAFSEAMYNKGSKRNGTNPDHRSEFDEYYEGEQDYDDFSSAKSLSGIVGVERCLIYEKLETGMSMYLDITRNQSRSCVLRAICEAQLLSEYYPDAPSSVIFEVIHLILKPSLGTSVGCYEDYLNAETAAFTAPNYCSDFVSKCPLNIAGLFLRNFFPDFTQTP